MIRTEYARAFLDSTFAEESEETRERMRVKREWNMDGGDGNGQTIGRFPGWGWRG